MSRSLDVLLLGLVGGLGWWVFARADRPLDEVAATVPSTGEVDVPAGPPAPALLPAEAHRASPRDVTVAVAVTWSVDDAALLAHPSFQFVVAEAMTGRLVPLAWQRDPAGRVSAEFAPGQRALGLALVHPKLEVLAWVPLDPTSGMPDERPVRIGERFARIALDVRAPDGQVVDDARLSLRSAEPARSLDTEPAALPVDADGKVLVPRRAGVRIDVQSARGTATVEEPFDGRTVQLEARGAR